ncbi:hypothetical protein ACLKA7_000080 [Drosophila subpalustris]
MRKGGGNPLKPPPTPHSSFPAELPTSITSRGRVAFLGSLHHSPLSLTTSQISLDAYYEVANACPVRLRFHHECNKLLRWDPLCRP